MTSSGHVIGQVLVAGGGADAGVDRIRALLDDGVATRGAGARRPRRRRGGSWSPSNDDATILRLASVSVFIQRQVDHLGRWVNSTTRSATLTYAQTQVVRYYKIIEFYIAHLQSTATWFILFRRLVFCWKILISQKMLSTLYSLHEINLLCGNND